jgi:hypothetical protein
MLLGFDFDRLRSGPFEGPAIVKPPALPGGTYFHSLKRFLDFFRNLLRRRQSDTSTHSRGKPVSVSNIK